MINLFIRRNLFGHIGRSTQSVVKPADVFAATVCQGNKVINKITGVTLEDDEPRAVNVHEVQKCNVVAIVATVKQGNKRVQRLQEQGKYSGFKARYATGRNLFGHVGRSIHSAVKWRLRLPQRRIKVTINFDIGRTRFG